MRNIITCINAWVSGLQKKGHLRTSFATGEIATDDMKEDNDLKERGGIARD